MLFHTLAHDGRKRQHEETLCGYSRLHPVGRESCPFYVQWPFVVFFSLYPRNLLLWTKSALLQLLPFTWTLDFSRSFSSTLILMQNIWQHCPESVRWEAEQELLRSFPWGLTAWICILALMYPHLWLWFICWAFLSISLLLWNVSSCNISPAPWSCEHSTWKGHRTVSCSWYPVTTALWLPPYY